MYHLSLPLSPARRAWGNFSSKRACGCLSVKLPKAYESFSIVCFLHGLFLSLSVLSLPHLTNLSRFPYILLVPAGPVALKWLSIFSSLPNLTVNGFPCHLTFLKSPRVVASSFCSVLCLCKDEWQFPSSSHVTSDMRSQIRGWKSELFWNFSCKHLAQKYLTFKERDGGEWHGTLPLEQYLSNYVYWRIIFPVHTMPIFKPSHLTDIILACQILLRFSMFTLNFYKCLFMTFKFR